MTEVHHLVADLCAQIERIQRAVEVVVRERDTLLRANVVLRRQLARPSLCCPKCESPSLRADGSCSNGDCCMFSPGAEVVP